MRWAVDAQIDMVQLRERDLTASQLATLVAECVAIARGTPTRVMVNDRLDIALACGASGVHLRGDSAPAQVVRRTVPAGFLVGQSVHSVDDAVASAPHVDYLIAGTIWPSTSKQSETGCLGPEGLAEIVQAVGVPVLAIGGVDHERLASVAATGAAGVAAIGWFQDPDATPGRCRAIRLHGMAADARAQFDRAR